VQCRPAQATYLRQPWGRGSEHDSSRRRNDLNTAVGSKALAAVDVNLGAAERAREEAPGAPGHGQHGAASTARDPRGGRGGGGGMSSGGSACGVAQLGQANSVRPRSTSSVSPHPAHRTSRTPSSICAAAAVPAGSVEMR